MAKATKKSSTAVSADDFRDGVIASLDQRIEALERKLAPYQKWINLKNQLLAARRAMLREGGQTGNAGTRVTMQEVYDYFMSNPGSTPTQAAERFEVKLTTITSHLSRNKDRFIKKDGRYWARDPEAGINTADDIEDEEDN